MSAALLIELRTEELPPKALKQLSTAFAEALRTALLDEGFLTAASAYRIYATPRRLGLLLQNVAAQAPDREVLAKGPSVQVGIDPNGNPSAALLGFARKQGVDVSHLQRLQDGKNEIYAYRNTVRGAQLTAVLQAKIEAALKRLPIPKMMRWGNGTAQFVRPLRGVIVLHGNDVISCSVLGIQAGRITLGHRFMGQGTLTIARAEDYESRLEREGKVIANFEDRLQRIRTHLQDAAGMAKIAADDALYDEVAALVEYPAVYSGHFDAGFLAVPQECLMLTMQKNQKYFPLTDDQGKLLNRFLLVSNIDTTTPDNIIRGNERVLRARLADAKFFYDQDRKQRLETWIPKLANVVYHNKLGTQLQRVERLQKLSRDIAKRLNADEALAGRAALLAKADLETGMVGEFPELQGLMGRYYATHDGEAPQVAAAIEAHYRPRFAGDELPDDPIGDCVALADKLEILVGIWSTGAIPTGDKDPFGLRRAALGIVRILLEKRLPLDVAELIDLAGSNFKPMVGTPTTLAVAEFIVERLKHYLRDKGFDAGEVEAVVFGAQKMRFDDVNKRLQAIRAFKELPQAKDLAAANKRVVNILSKSPQQQTNTPDRALMHEQAEIALYDALERIRTDSKQAQTNGDYVQALSCLAGMRDEIDRFFNEVMVMAEDPAIRANRLHLLSQLAATMNQVADISKLAT